MSTVLASSIIGKAQILIQDLTGVRWPVDELLGWLNDGQRAVLIIKPNANVKNMSLQLVSGTKQSLPNDGIQLIDIPRNMGADGITAGRAIRITMREILDAQLQDWHMSTPSSVVQHFMYNSLDPKNFYNYPPQPSSGMGFVEIIYSASPTDIAIGSVICLDDIYESVLLDYVLYRAFSKDATYAANPQRANKYESAYLTALTGKMAVEAATSPNRTAVANPNASANYAA